MTESYHRCFKIATLKNKHLANFKTVGVSFEVTIDRDWTIWWQETKEIQEAPQAVASAILVRVSIWQS